MFAKDQGDLGSIPGRVIPNTLKMVLDTSLLNTQQYHVRIKGVKWSNLGKGVAPTPTPRRSSHWKESLLVALDYCHQLYLYIYIYIYIYILIYGETVSLYHNSSVWLETPEASRWGRNPPNNPSVCLAVCMYVCLSVCLSLSLSLYIYIYIYITQYFSPSLSLSLSMDISGHVVLMSRLSLHNYDTRLPKPRKLR